MDSAHLIEDLVFDLHFSSEERAFEEHARLESCVKGSAVAAIEQVLDDFAMSGEVVRLERLEVDLGTIPFDGLETEMTARLRARLQAALHEHRRVQSTESVSRAQVPTQKQDEVDVLMHFLRTGLLPWHANRRTIGSAERLASRVIRESGEQFARELRSGGGDQVIGRLARQLPEASLLGVVRVMVPHAVASVERLVRSLLDICVQVRFRNGSAARARTLIWEAILTELVRASGATVDLDRLAQVSVGVIAREMGDERVQSQLWEFTLTYLLVERGTTFNRRSYMGSVLRQMALRDGIDYEALLDGITSALPAIQPIDRAHKQIMDVLMELGEGRRRRPSAEPDWVARNAKKVRKAFEAALENGIAGNVSEDWAQLLAHDAEWVEALLRREGQRAAVRRRIAESFPEPLLIAIVDLLVPAGREYVETVVAHSEVFSREVNPSAHQASALKSQLWAFTLTYLLVERGSTFNRRSYMGSVLRQMALRDGTDYEELLDGITSALRAIQPIDRAHKQILDVLLELGEGRRRRPSAEPDWVARNAKLFPGYDLDDLLRRRLQGEPGDGTDLVAGIELLAREHPERLSRLKRELQTGVLPWRVARTRFSAIELEALAKALVGLGGAGSAAFLSSIEEYAGQSDDRMRYYAEILSCLVEDKPVDLEVIVATSSGAPSKPHGEPEQQTANARAHAEKVPSASQTGGVDVKPLQRDARTDATEAELLGYLRGTHTLTASEAGALRQSVVSGIEQRSDRLRRQIEFALDNSQAAARIIDLLPAEILARLLRLLRSADYHRIQRTADLLGDASESIVFPSQRGQIERLKWECILHYLFERGRSFSVADFAREFARYVAAQLRPTEPQRWRLDLKQEVNTCDRTADREIVRDIGLGLSQGHDVIAAETVRQPRATSPRKELAPGEAIYVENAGLVLAAAYVPRLFAMLTLTDSEKFKEADAAERGVHLLQYLATGLSAGPEYQLALNKLLCGVALDTPVIGEIEITAEERLAIDGLVEAMIQHWKALGKTSVAGLRESFLQREGRLTHDDHGWRLLVQPRAFDMLLDQIPWGFATVKLPWMEEVIHVEWR